MTTFRNNLVLNRNFLKLVVHQPLNYNLVGFDTDSSFAYGASTDPSILHVDTLDSSSSFTDSTHGSLEWCIEQNFPRIIVFDVGGLIDYTTNSDANALLVDNDNVWVAGQTAPSPGITIRGTTFKIQASDVLVQHLKVEFGDFTTGVDPVGGDCFQIYDSSNVVLNKCTMRWGMDELLDD